ncbi:hypothetical protein O3G_MSEX011721 [Manduca sexta]|uniref:Uncharacterized protein n=1 Tax=Manduca sexta TaxID=7130 RepID=A0A921ZLH9_MANSE|nr:hypothetical protein O3G_MSEX011721 [Manduca sexta]
MKFTRCSRALERLPCTTQPNGVSDATGWFLLPFLVLVANSRCQLSCPMRMRGRTSRGSRCATNSSRCRQSRTASRDIFCVASFKSFTVCASICWVRRFSPCPLILNDTRRDPALFLVVPSYVHMCSGSSGPSIPMLFARSSSTRETVDPSSRSAKVSTAFLGPKMRTGAILRKDTRGTHAELTCSLLCDSSFFDSTGLCVE